MVGLPAIPEEDDDELLLDDDDELLLDDDELLLDEELLDEDDPELEPGSSCPPQPTTSNTANSGIDLPNLSISDTLIGTSLLFAANIDCIDAPSEMLVFCGSLK